MTVVSSSRYFEPAFATAWAEHDPQRARALLNEMGLIDRNGDGRRDHPDGHPLEITLEYTIGETPKQVTVDLVTAHWREVGMHINRKQISGALQGIRTRGGGYGHEHLARRPQRRHPLSHRAFLVRAHARGAGGDPVAGVVAVWYRSDGVRGWMPPDKVRDLIAWWEVLRRTPDLQERIAMGKKILQSQAENLWALGIIGLGPHPVIVSNRLRNVPRQGYWGWDSRWSWPYYPETWYLQPD